MPDLIGRETLNSVPCKCCMIQHTSPTLSSCLHVLRHDQSAHPNGHPQNPIHLSPGAIKRAASRNLTPGSSFHHVHGCLSPIHHFCSLHPRGPGSMTPEERETHNFPSLVRTWGLKMQCSPSLMCFNSWSPFDGLAWEGCGTVRDWS